MLPAEIGPDAAAERLAHWLADAVTAEAAPRVAFVRDRFGAVRFADICLRHYTGRPVGGAP
jgi:hypothetical protein